MNINKYIDLYLKRKGEKSITELYKNLKSIGNLYIMGGFARELYNFSKTGKIENVRDIDIVIDTMGNTNLFNNIIKKYNYNINKFGGYKIIFNNLKIDVWEINNTWAFKENIIKYDRSNMGKDLQNTVFLNYDSIVYDVNNEKFYFEQYMNCLSERILDIVLKDNPHIYLNLVRALEFKLKTGYTFSYRLRNMFQKAYLFDKNFINRLYEIEKNRDNIMSKHELINEVENIINCN